MINRIRGGFLLLSLLLFSGCAFINSFNGNLDKKIDIWMSQHEYAKILDTLSYVRSSNPKYKLLQQKRQQAIVAARAYRKKQISKAMDLMERGQWNEANITLTDTIHKLPPNPALDAAYQEFLQQRAQYLQSLYYQLSINKAESLIKDRPVLEQLRQTLPNDDKTQQSLSDYQDNIYKIHQKLITCGQTANSKDDLELAQQCYQLAEELQPGTKIKRTITLIRNKLNARLSPNKNSGAQAPTISLLGHNLLEKSKTAFKQGDLNSALHYYNKIPDSDKQLIDVRLYGEKMHQVINDNVREGIELGRRLYSQGQVEQALAVWNRLRDLAPDNDNLFSHIDRAERVLQKIKQLRKEQKQSNQGKPTGSPRQ